MTYGELSESIWISMNGGGMSPSSNLQRVDITNILPTMLNAALMKFVVENRNNARADGDRSFDISAMMNEYILPLKSDSPTKKLYAELDGIILTTLVGPMISDVMCSELHCSFCLVKSVSATIGTEDLGVNLAWLTETNDKSRIYISSPDAKGCSLYVRAILASHYDEDKEVLFPADVIEMAIVATRKLLAKEPAQRRVLPIDDTNEQ